MANLKKITDQLDVITGASWVYKPGIIGLGAGKLLVEIFEDKEKQQLIKNSIEANLGNLGLEENTLEPVAKSDNLFYIAGTAINESSIKNIKETFDQITKTATNALKYISGRDWKIDNSSNNFYPAYATIFSNHQDALDFIEFYSAAGIAKYMKIEGNKLLFHCKGINNSTTAQQLAADFDNFKQIIQLFFAHIIHNYVIYNQSHNSTEENSKYNKELDGQINAKIYFSKIDENNIGSLVVESNSYNQISAIHNYMQSRYKNAEIVSPSNSDDDSEDKWLLTIPANEVAKCEVANFIKQLTCRSWEFEIKPEIGKGCFFMRFDADRADSDGLTPAQETNVIMRNFNHWGIEGLTTSLASTSNNTQAESVANSFLYLVDPKLSLLCDKARAVQHDVIELLYRTTGQRKWKAQILPYGTERRSYFLAEFDPESESELMQQSVYSLRDLVQHGFELKFEIWQDGRRYDYDESYLGVVPVDHIEKDRIIIRYHRLIAGFADFASAVGSIAKQQWKAGNAKEISEISSSITNQDTDRDVQGFTSSSG